MQAVLKLSLSHYLCLLNGIIDWFRNAGKLYWTFCDPVQGRKNLDLVATMSTSEKNEISFPL